MSQRTLLQRLPQLFNVLLIVGVIVSISLLFPTNLKFKYDYERGQTWNNEDLLAPFDFAILKTDAELAAERAEVLQTLTPVYIRTLDQGRTRRDSFAAAFERQLRAERAQGNSEFRDVLRRPTAYLQYGEAMLDRFYQRGILKLDPEHQQLGNDQVITIVAGNEVREQTLGNLLTPEEALMLLNDSLPYMGLPEPEFIYPLLEEQVAPNLYYSDSLTQRLRAEALSGVATSHGMVRKGELLVANGAVITDNTYQKLVSFQRQYEEEISNQQLFGVYTGYLLLTSLIIVIFATYLRVFAKLVYNRFNKLVFAMSWPLAYSYLMYLEENVEVLSPYMIPFCIVPIVIKTFYNERIALFTHLMVVLVASLLTSLGYAFVLLQILAGIVVLLTRIDTRNWSRFFYSMLFVFLSYGVGYLGLSLVQEGNLRSIDWSVYSWIALNVFLTLLAYPLIPLLERLFGFLSPITLVELLDMNSPLLRGLALRAPGTLQHSLQVAHLAEAAARRIGADDLLVRVGALYHDVGKTINPAFFIENQAGKNPHEGLTEQESARMIINHVTEGVALAKKHGLPSVIIDFIRTHHGTTRVEYFYRNFQHNHPDETVDLSQFSYPGPRPRTKEETVLMLADSLEAAAKSLKNPDEQSLHELIDKIIAAKVTNRQLEDSQLSFRELEECKMVFRQMLRSIHHVRIAYPEEQKQTSSPD